MKACPVVLTTTHIVVIEHSTVTRDVITSPEARTRSKLLTDSILYQVFGQCQALF